MWIHGNDSDTDFIGQSSVNSMKMTKMSSGTVFSLLNLLVRILITDVFDYIVGVRIATSKKLQREPSNKSAIGQYLFGME